MSMSADESVYKFEFLTGHKEFRPLQYRIVGGEVATRRWWQRRREEWFIKTEFSSLGPFASRAEATVVLTLCGERETPAEAMVQ
jgi:hypothetical protein